MRHKKRFRKFVYIEKMLYLCAQNNIQGKNTNKKHILYD